MLTLRQEAMQIVNDIPDDLLAEFVKHLNNFKFRVIEKNKHPKEIASSHRFSEEEFQKFLHSGSGINPKKAAAFAALEKWKEENKDFLTSDIDWEQERWEAMNEKYGPLD